MWQESRREWHDVEHKVVASLLKVEHSGRSAAHGPHAEVGQQLEHERLAARFGRFHLHLQMAQGVGPTHFGTCGRHHLGLHHD